MVWIGNRFAGEPYGEILRDVVQVGAVFANVYPQVQKSENPVIPILEAAGALTRILFR
jgi:hypothetical protein